MAASAVAPDRYFDDLVDEPLVLPGQRTALRPVAPTEKPGNDCPEDPLRLGRKMRLRLRDAVQALLADPSIVGQSDVARLAAVVLYAKSRAPKGDRNDNVTSIWVAELGRWMGVGESTVHRRGLAPLRASDGLHTEEVRDAQGYPTGLRCLVMPLWQARTHGGARHPLALSKAELATLLRLIEALFGHGWTPEDKDATPPGLLAGRRGKGAATDRLALLLMVLNTRASGWLQLVGGSVKKREGRGAATLARLLGCSPAGARKVLARLTEAGVVVRQRRTTSTRMNGRARVMVLPVARAYGRTLASVEAVQSPESMFSARPDGAGGDHAPAGTAGALGTTGIGGAEGTEGGADQERPDGAELHAVHASGVTAVVPPQLSCGFSGEGRGGTGGLPERVCVREDQAVDGDAAARLTLVDGEGGPLRGEKPQKSPVAEAGKGNCGPVAGGSVRAVDDRGQGRQQRGRVALPSLDLRAVLAPVRLVWARLERPPVRRLVEAKVRTELRRVAGVTGPADAPQILADRLARRLEHQMRLGPITDPVGWLIGRGLPQIQLCAEPRCDEGELLDSGRDCPRCEDRQVDSRATRKTVAAAVDAAMPGASETERRAATDRQLHETVTARAWAQAYRWEQVRVRQAAAKAARAEAAVVQPVIDAPAVPVTSVVLPAPHPAVAVPAPDLESVDVDDGQELVLEDLTPDEIRQWRVRGMKDHQVVIDHIDRYGEPSARRLFSNQLVDQAEHRSGLEHLNLGYSTWGQA
ncbi:hypothetical protein [Streptomyces sp. NPDC051561]|uniref:hypothetical protein n=1 Tax=Streptomyces sp. NPDC051561 TaxID=3365658 RepID=UPI00379F9177